MDAKEAKAMLGTEFRYTDDEGKSIKCYVKAFDPEIGLTCMSLGSKSECGFQVPKYRLDAEGSVCMIGINIKEGIGSLESAYEKLQEIKDTGEFVSKSSGVANCAF